jgi:hypothetical protein
MINNDKGENMEVQGMSCEVWASEKVRMKLHARDAAAALEMME